MNLLTRYERNLTQKLKKNHFLCVERLGYLINRFRLALDRSDEFSLLFLQKAFFQFS